MHDLYSKNRPVFRVLAGACMISFSAIFVKFANVPPTTSGFYRVFFGFIFLLATTLWRKDQVFPPPRHLPLVLFCGIAFALDLYFWHESIFFIGPGLATLISNFQVFLLAAVGIFFLKEKANFRFLAAIPLALLGLFLIVGRYWNSLTNDYKTGIYYSLLTALCYTFFLLGLRKIQTDKSQSFFSTLMAISLLCSLFLGSKVFFSESSFSIPDTTSLLALLALGLFCQTIGWALIAGAMPKIRASFTGLILLLQPTLSFVWDVLIFNRPTDLLNWLGVIFTLIAIYLGLTGRNDKA